MRAATGRPGEYSVLNRPGSQAEYAHLETTARGKPPTATSDVYAHLGDTRSTSANVYKDMGERDDGAEATDAGGGSKTGSGPREGPEYAQPVRSLAVGEDRRSFSA